MIKVRITVLSDSEPIAIFGTDSDDPTTLQPGGPIFADLIEARNLIVVPLFRSVNPLEIPKDGH